MKVQYSLHRLGEEFEPQTILLFRSIVKSSPSAQIRIVIEL
jgi:hypothetical protein